MCLFFLSLASLSTRDVNPPRPFPLLRLLKGAHVVRNSTLGSVNPLPPFKCQAIRTLLPKGPDPLQGSITRLYSVRAASFVPILDLGMWREGVAFEDGVWRGGFGF